MKEVDMCQYISWHRCRYVVRLGDMVGSMDDGIGLASLRNKYKGQVLDILD